MIKRLVALREVISLTKDKVGLNTIKELIEEQITIDAANPRRGSVIAPLLGNSLYDAISGFRGIAISFCISVEGIEEYLIQPRMRTSDGSFVEPQWFRLSRLRNVDVDKDNKIKDKEDA